MYPVSIGDEHEDEGLSEIRNKNQGEQSVSSFVPSCSRHILSFRSFVLRDGTMNGMEVDEDLSKVGSRWLLCIYAWEYEGRIDDIDESQGGPENHDTISII